MENKTIEEKARQLAAIQGGISDYGKKVIEKCCIKIATDQQKIDIEKACDCFRKEIENTIQMPIGIVDGMVFRFRKAIEE